MSMKTMMLKKWGCLGPKILSIKSFTEKLRNYSISAHQKTVMARGLPKQKPIKGVKRVILVASGKGGVGKTTTACNLATGLKLIYPQKNVGLLDADIFGPSVPLMMNLQHDDNKPLLNRDNLMKPLINYGVKCMSFGFLIDESSPVVWRGLMVMQALENLLRQVKWDEIDYLIIDTPPGTGDTHLSLIQSIPINGVVLVTTPQKAALQVTKRGALMYKNLNIPLIGLVENMSFIECSSCSKNISLFGDVETEKLAHELDVKILEKIPLNSCISEGSDQGIPIVLNAGHSHSNYYKNLAKLVADYFEK